MTDWSSCRVRSLNQTSNVVWNSASSACWFASWTRYPSSRKADPPLGVRELEDAGVLGEDLLGELVDVRALVPVRRRLLPQRPRQDRVAEQVHLRPAVVDVELLGDLRPGGLEHPRQRVPDRRPPGVPEVQRPRRVRGDELDVDPLAVEQVRPPVLAPRRHDVRRDLALGSGLDRDVQEPRPGHLDVRDALGVLQLGRELGRQVTWVGTCLLGQLQRHVRRVVPVPLLPRPLDRDLARYAVRQRQLAAVHQPPKGRDDRVTELLRSHRPRLSARRHTPRIDITRWR